MKKTLAVLFTLLFCATLLDSLRDTDFCPDTTDMARVSRVTHSSDAACADAAMAAGLGVAVLFAREAAAALTPSVRLVPIVPQTSSQIMLVWLDNRITEEHQRRFLSCMKQRAEALPGDLQERPSDLS